MTENLTVLVVVFFSSMAGAFTAHECTSLNTGIIYAARLIRRWRDGLPDAHYSDLYSIPIRRMRAEFMTVQLKRSMFAAAIVLGALAIHWTQAEMSGALAQQRNQTNLDFASERARIGAVQRRIDALRKRLDVVAATANQAATGEHILLGRDGPPPQGSGASNKSRTRNENNEREAERRIPSTIRHRDRTVTAAELDALRSRLGAAEQSARSLGERVNRLDFGTDLRALEQELDRIEADISSYQ
jgi:hypothetical protein